MLTVTAGCETFNDVRKRSIVTGIPKNRKKRQRTKAGLFDYDANFTVDNVLAKIIACDIERGIGQ